MQAVVHPIKLNLPAGWRANALIVVGPPVNVTIDGETVPFQPNLTVSSEDIGKTPLRAYVGAQVDAMRREQVIKDVVTGIKELKLASGVSGFTHEHTVSLNEDVTCQQLQFYTVVEGTAYVFTLTHLAGELFTAERPTFEALISSVGIVG